MIMTRKSLFLLPFWAFLLIGCASSLKDGTVALSLDHSSGVYALGQSCRVSGSFSGNLDEQLKVRILVNNQPSDSFNIRPMDGEMVLYEDACDATRAVMVEISGANLELKQIGYVVAPEGFEAGLEEPSDLMDYWNNQRALLDALPFQVKSTPLEVPEQYAGGYTLEDVEINCLGPAPVRAYLSKPKNAKEHSLPIVIQCRAAGVKGSWCLCNANECVSNAALGSGALSLDLNAHGFLNGQPQEYYDYLETGPLKGYSTYAALDRETWYFKGMYLRLMRAIEFMTRQKEWDGERILVMGESQGGGQAAASAGLDQRVTAVALFVPAIQDLGGKLKGRLSGWPKPLENHPDRIDAQMKVLPYFDGAMLLRHSRAQIFCEIGLIDTTCPPAAVWSSLNGAPGEKTVLCVPYRDHHAPSGALHEVWEKDYLQPRMAYINDYLK